jgi:hypothetical protein
MNGELKVELVELYSVGAACADLDVEAAKQSKFRSASSIFGFALRPQEGWTNAIPSRYYTVQVRIVDKTFDVYWPVPLALPRTQAHFFHRFQIEDLVPCHAKV